MAYNKRLADRVRAILDDLGESGEIKMFGGLCFTVRGNMAGGVLGDDLIVRVPADDTDAYLAKPHARPFDMMAGRTPRGFVLVSPAGTKTAKSLDAWVKVGYESAFALPPKTKKAGKPKAFKTAPVKSAKRR